MVHLQHHNILSTKRFHSHLSIVEAKKLFSFHGSGSKSCKIFENQRTGGVKSVGAVERDSEFEIDPDKAREALRKLDEQLQSLSKKQISPPKIRASDLNRARDDMVETTSEFSASFLAFFAMFLILFTIGYNVLFITVIKPAIDGPEEVAVTDSKSQAQEFVPITQD